MAIQWVSTMATGLDWQDRQHQRLISHLNDFLEAMNRHEGQVEVARLLAFLHDYTATHFASEEAWLRKHKSPDLDAHTTQHKLLLEQLNRFTAEYGKGGASTMLVMQVQSWMRDWVLDHIIHEDRKLATFAQTRGLTA